MRKLMWFTIGFAASCGLGAYGRGKVCLPLSLFLLVTASVAWICIRQKHRFVLPAMAVLWGCAVGALWFGGYHALYLQPVSILDGEVVSLTITASDYSYETDYGMGVDGMTTLGEKPYRIRTYLREDTIVTPGDRIEGTFRLGVTGEKDSRYFQGKGIFLTASQKGELTLTPAQSVPKWCFPAVLRQRMLTRLEALFPADVAPFTKALLLGDGRDLDYATDTAFKVSGIRHIIAVSGLHISILYGLICVVTLRKRFLTAAVGMPVILLFAAVAGFTPSVTRACIMVWLMLLAMVMDQEYDPATSLAFSVLVMLAVNPMAVTSVSLQLSMGCVAGILLFQNSIYQWMKKKLPPKMPKKLSILLCGSISVPLSAMSLTTPLAAYYFGTVSLVSVLTNLLTLGVVNLIFHGLIVVCLLAVVLPVAAEVLAWILAWPIRYVLVTTKILAAFPLAAVYTKSSYVVFWLLFVYILLAVFLLEKKKQPEMLLCCTALGLCVALLASWALPLTADTRITVLDVGQGQSILLQSEGKTFLVDCGGDTDAKVADTIAETLLSQGIHRLDGIILTHYDRDHAGAIHPLLTRVDTDILFLPDTRNDMPLPNTSGRVVYVWEDLELSFGNSRMEIFGPVSSGVDNENSLCVLFDTEKCDILITGDRSAFGERMLLRRNPLQDVDILVAGHHGAADATSEELLKAVTPETVLICVGANNIFGHPDPVLLQRLERFGCGVYRTDLDGTILIRR